MRRLPVVSGLAAFALLLGGCSAAGSSAATADDCVSAHQPIAELALTEDVRSATGGSTACLSSDSIEAVSDDTAPKLPATVVDSEGTEVTVGDVSRILPLDISGTIAATVFGLGLGDNVVGRDISTDFHGTEELPVVTKSSHTLNAEAILELAPTVVVTDTTIGPKEVRQQLRDAGIPVVVVSSDHDADTVGDLVAEVAAALGVPSRGDALTERIEADIEDALAEIAAVVPADVEDRARILFLYVRGSANVYYIFGHDSGADSLIDAIGGVDVATEIGWEGEKPMTAEALVAAQPDVILMMTDGLASVGGIDGLLERIPALQQTQAGQNRRVIDMADGQILGFGPRTAEVIMALAKALYAPADTAAPTAGPSDS
ncbi:heme/hemin ABC transporter substrate-binding protein [Microbacterium sp. GXF7504]